jgi:CHAT domain-containing protein/tetratricopeptide (TPR) repeat protein
MMRRAVVTTMVVFGMLLILGCGEPDSAPRELEPLSFEEETHGRVSSGSPVQYALELDDGVFLDLRFRTDDVQKVDVSLTTSEGVRVEPLEFPLSGFHELRFVATGEVGAPFSLAVVAATNDSEQIVYTVRPEFFLHPEPWQTALAHAQFIRSSGEGSELSEAIDHYLEALDSSAPDALTLKAELSYLASLALFDAGRYEECLEYAERASLPDGDVPFRASVAYHMGVTLFAMEDPGAARQAFEQALGLYRQGRDSKHAAACLSQLGHIYSQQGDSQRALETLRQALAIRRDLGDEAGAARTRYHIAGVHLALGALDEALREYESLREAWPDSRDSREYCSLLNALGVAHRRNGELKEAVECYSEALSIARDSGYSDMISLLVNSLGVAHHHRSVMMERAGELEEVAVQRQKAVDYYDEALQQLPSGTKPLTRAAILINTGRLEQRNGNFASAIGRFEEVCAIRRRVRNTRGLVEAFAVLADAHREAGNLIEAKGFIEKSLGVLEDLIDRISVEDLQLKLISKNRHRYELHVEILMELHREYPGHGYDRMAFEAGEQAKAKVLRDLLLGQKTAIRRGDVDGAWLTEEQRLASTAARIDAELHECLVKDDCEEANRYETELTETLRALEDLRGKIRAADPSYDHLIRPPVVGVSEIQAVLDDRTVLLAYIVGREGSYRWVLSSNHLEATPLPGRGELEDLAKRARDLMAAPDDRLSSERLDGVLGQLSQHLLPPEVARYDRVVLVPDDALHLVPFAALSLPGTVQPMVAAHHIVSMPSASVLVDVLEAGKPRHRTGEPVVSVLADPVVSLEDSRLRSGPVEDSRVEAEDDHQGEQIRSLGIGGLAPLQWSDDEARAIASLAPNHNIRLGFDANVEGLRTAMASRDAVLHISTHAVLNTEQPQLSGLVLSLYDERGDPQDGVFYAMDLYDEHLQHELLVLSACDTALGKEIRGEGMVGLTRAAFFAGCPRVVSTLWQVDDRATAYLMTEFYEELLVSQRSAPEALRIAQQRVRSTESWGHPYYWAGFVFQGNWNDIQW